MYGFASGDPINYQDPFGLCAQGASDTVKVEVCEAVADIPLNMLKAKHKWFRVGNLEAGLGQEGGGVPGEGEYEYKNNSPFFTQTEVTDHSGRGNAPGATCRATSLVPSCVTSALQIGQKRGAWTPTNQCWSFVNEVSKSCAPPPPIPAAAPADATRVATTPKR